MLQVRLPSPTQAHGAAWTALALVVGATLLALPLAAVATQGLDDLDRLEALMLAFAGLVIAGWGVLQLARGRALLRWDAALQLDERGVTLHNGPDRDLTVTFVAWPDVAGVEVAWWRILQPYVDEPQDLPVLRLLTRHDGEVTVGSLGELTHRLGQSFGIPPEAAALVAVLDPSGLDAVHQVQAWLAAHQPRVPVEIGAPPDL